MKIHILGICGTFMGGVAVLAREAGHEVSGSDENVYPPMSTMLESKGIDITEGYDYLRATVVAGECAAESLGSGCCRNPWQNDYRQYAGLDFGRC